MCVSVITDLSVPDDVGGVDDVAGVDDVPPGAPEAQQDAVVQDLGKGHNGEAHAEAEQSAGVA